MAQPLIEGNVGLIFPGQGSQFVGMATKLAEASPAAKARLTEANDTLGFDLAGLMANGPAETLEDTVNAQPAILAASVAAHAAIIEAAAARELELTAIIGAGHSLGEFSALVAAGSLAYADALRIVRERGRLMKEAGDASPGGMSAILGVDDDKLAEICAEASDLGVIVIANANCPGQTVISGEVAALEKAMELAKAAGARRAVRLGVSIAAHSPLMTEANRAFAAAIDAATISDPAWPVLSNAGVQPLTDAASVRAELLAHMEGPVLWTQTVQAMKAAGATTLLELGPGAVLAGLVKRIDRDLPVKSIGDLGLELPVDAG
ncbi:MAG: ACP S-malonyltransferase [Thermomicrobiales bacterium]|nr:ACP S-malonyltransferase [Thermomicrobiales bacterium]